MDSSASKDTGQAEVEAQAAPSPAEVAAQKTLARVEAALAGIDYQVERTTCGTACISVAPEHVGSCFAPLRDVAGFASNTFVTAIDHEPAEPRFEVLFQFLSIEHNDRVRITTRIAEENPVVPSCTPYWPGASFSERECFDMFGIRFDGHGDLRRLMMPEEYDHFPLRKDFPHQGIEPDKLYRQWDEERRAEWELESNPKPKSGSSS